MPRARTIRHEFLHSRSMREMSLGARLAFVHLWLIADDAGRVVDHPVSLPRQLFRHDDEARRLAPGWIDELARQHCIERYTVDGDGYLRITNWRRYQKIYHPTPSRLPPKPVSRAVRESLGNEARNDNRANDLGAISRIPEPSASLVNRSGENLKSPSASAFCADFPSDS